MTYEVGDLELGLATRGSSGRSGRGLGWLCLLGGLGDTTDRGLGGTATWGRTTSATAAAVAAAGGLEDVVERGVELVGHGDGFAVRRQMDVEGDWTELSM